MNMLTPVNGNKCNLNKSFSEPNVSSISNQNLNRTADKIFVNDKVHVTDYPCVRRFYYEEVFHRNNYSSPTLLKRQYSCEEIRSPSFMHVSYNRSKLNHLNDSMLSQDSFCTENNSILSCEPMDVDMQTNSSREMTENSFKEETGDNCDKFNISLTEDSVQHKIVNEISSQEQPITKRKQINEETKSNLHNFKVVRKKDLPNYVKLCLLATIVATLGVLLNAIIFDYKAQINIERLEEQLNSKLYKQQDPIHSVLSNLKFINYNWRSNVKVVSFIGRKGTGKTFIANMVKDNFYHKLVNDLHSDLLRNPSEQDRIINNLYVDYCNLIVIDDLTVDDMEILHDFIRRLEQENALVLIISIFSIQKVDNSLTHTVDYHDIGNIQTAFSKNSIFSEAVVFDEFDESHVKEWVHNQLVLSKIDQKYHNKIHDNILSAHDVYKDGFKGLHVKLAKEVQETEYDF